MKGKREALEALAEAIRDGFWKDAAVDCYPSGTNLVVIEVCGLKVAVIGCKYGSYGWEIDFDSTANTMPPSGLTKLHNRLG